MRQRPVSLLLALAALFAAPQALAQKPPAPASATSDAALAAQKDAFLAMPETTRKAAQDALVWLGVYNGTNDGDFGKRTRDAILAWQRRVKAKPDGVLDPGLVQALLGAGLNARDAAGFRTIVDGRTGARIGAPTKLLARGAKLDLVSDSTGDLAALYAKLSATTATRKIAYKAMKPNAFFVLSGQDGGRKFYTRYDEQEGAKPPIRGFVFSYPAEAAGTFDRVAVAVANSFEPFPSNAPASAPPPPPLPPAPRATALIVGPGRAVTALNPADCQNPMIGGKPARFEKTDPSGLAVLVGDFAANGQPPKLGPMSSDLVALSAPGDRIAASPASAAGETKRPAVVAALDQGASGGPLFDRVGRLVGLVAPIGEAPKRVGSVALASSYPVIDADAVGAFLGGGALVPEPAPAASAPMSAGAIAEREKGAVVPVFCGK